MLCLVRRCSLNSSALSSLVLHRSQNRDSMSGALNGTSSGIHEMAWHRIKQ
jgi:hypothetical protein